ncbi:MAG: DUF3168 domain-containing protein [Synergistaceae bacterium]|nr:DUF3168 domain-containing protein [Synergistaceae bacterium]
MTVGDLYGNITKALLDSEKLTVIVGPGGVYDFTPDENTAGPYVVVGEFVEGPGRLVSCEETEVTFTIHVWSSSFGRFETLDIKDVINEILFEMWGECFWLESFKLIHDVSQWCHGVLTYRTFIKEEE